MKGALQTLGKGTLLGAGDTSIHDLRCSGSASRLAISPFILLLDGVAASPTGRKVGVSELDPGTQHPQASAHLGTWSPALRGCKPTTRLCSLTQAAWAPVVPGLAGLPSSLALGVTLLHRLLPLSSAHPRHLGW